MVFSLALILAIFLLLVMVAHFNSRDQLFSTFSKLSVQIYSSGLGFTFVV